MPWCKQPPSSIRLMNWPNLSTDPHNPLNWNLLIASPLSQATLKTFSSEQSPWGLELNSPRNDPQTQLELVTQLYRNERSLHKRTPTHQWNLHSQIHHLISERNRNSLILASRAPTKQKLNNGRYLKRLPLISKTICSSSSSKRSSTRMMYPRR